MGSPGSRWHELWLKVPFGCGHRRVARHPGWVWGGGWPQAVSTPTPTGFLPTGEGVSFNRGLCLSNKHLCIPHLPTLQTSEWRGPWVSGSGETVWSEGDFSACQGEQFAPESLTVLLVS